MATSNSHNHLFYASLLYLFLFSSLENNAFALQAKKISHQFLHSIEVSNLLPSTTCKHSSNVAKNPATLKVVHKHGPCFQHQNPQQNTNSPNVLENILLEDQVRVKSIHSRFSKTSAAGNVEETKATKLPAERGSKYNTGNYVVTIGLGTPKKELAVAFDTGSDLTWSKCKPGVDVLDPTKSTSYSNVSCSSPFCSAKGGGVTASRCSSTNCQYAVQYGDQSLTIGFLGQETLTLGSTDTFEKFYFGCSQNSQGLFGSLAGLLGLGRNKISVVSQTAAKYNKLFSYCIPAQSSTGFLSFGSSQSKSPKYVPLKTTTSNFYDLELTGITVGGKKLQIPNSVFSSAGTIIDSGTVITRLPPAAYSALKSAFKEAMSQYPAADPFSILDTCFDFSKSTTISFPKIVLSFNEATNVEIDKTGVFVGTGPNQVCLAFAGNSKAGDIAIIGNTQQRTLEVIYDIGGGKVGFATAGCT